MSRQNRSRLTLAALLPPDVLEKEALENGNVDMPCMVCGKTEPSLTGGGESSFVLCDGCETGGGHVECLGLPAIPKGDWCCVNCAPARETDVAAAAGREQ